MNLPLNQNNLTTYPSFQRKTQKPPFGTPKTSMGLGGMNSVPDQIGSGIVPGTKLASVNPSSTTAHVLGLQKPTIMIGQSHLGLYSQPSAAAAASAGKSNLNAGLSSKPLSTSQDPHTSTPLSTPFQKTPTKSPFKGFRGNFNSASTSSPVAPPAMSSPSDSPASMNVSKSSDTSSTQSSPKTSISNTPSSVEQPKVDASTSLVTEKILPQAKIAEMAPITGELNAKANNSLQSHETPISQHSIPPKSQDTPSGQSVNKQVPDSLELSSLCDIDLTEDWIYQTQAPKKIEETPPTETSKSTNSDVQSLNANTVPPRVPNNSPETTSPNDSLDQSTIVNPTPQNVAVVKSPVASTSSNSQAPNLDLNQALAEITMLRSALAKERAARVESDQKQEKARQELEFAKLELAEQAELNAATLASIPVASKPRPSSEASTNTNTATSSKPTPQNSLISQIPIRKTKRGHFSWSEKDLAKLGDFVPTWSQDDLEIEWLQIEEQANNLQLNGPIEQMQLNNIIKCLKRYRAQLRKIRAVLIGANPAVIPTVSTQNTSSSNRTITFPQHSNKTSSTKTVLPPMVSQKSLEDSIRKNIETSLAHQLEQLKNGLELTIANQFSSFHSEQMQALSSKVDELIEKSVVDNVSNKKHKNSEADTNSSHASSHSIDTSSLELSKSLEHIRSLENELLAHKQNMEDLKTSYESQIEKLHEIHADRMSSMNQTLSLKDQELNQALERVKQLEGNLHDVLTHVLQKQQSQM